MRQYLTQSKQPGAEGPATWPRSLQEGTGQLAFRNPFLIQVYGNPARTSQGPPTFRL